MRLLILYGTLFSISLDCHGSCLARWWVCLHVGGPEVDLGVLLFEKWFLYALCDVYGWKETRDALRILRDLWRNLWPAFSTRFTRRQQVGSLP
jgi:hypothetical protein